MADEIDRLAALLKRVKKMIELDSELYESQATTLTDDEVIVIALESYQDHRHFYQIYRKAQDRLIDTLYQELDRKTRLAALAGKKNEADAIDKSDAA